MRKVKLHLVIIALLIALTPAARAEPFGAGAFEQLWARTDLPVGAGQARHSWIWGPQPFTPLFNEAYAEGPGGQRAVQYFDKGRMEINNPDGDPRSPWFVSSGLLVVELISGKVQIGAAGFIDLPVADIPFAGDPVVSAPTYASLRELYGRPAGRALGELVTDSFLRAETLPLTDHDPQATKIVRIEGGFGIPRVFWDFMNRHGLVYERGQYRQNQPLIDWLYLTGYPVTDAYWTRVPVGGVERDVLFQAFERRLLTYTPANPPPFQVEMGNVGRHYYDWRYAMARADEPEAFITLPAPSAVVASPLVVEGFIDPQREQPIELRLSAAVTGALLASEEVRPATPAGARMAGPFRSSLLFSVRERTTAVVELVAIPVDGSAETVLDRQEVLLFTADESATRSSEDWYATPGLFR